MKHTITCSEEQALVIQDALELFARLRLGQFEHIAWTVFPELQRGGPDWEYDNVVNALQIAAEAACNAAGTTYASISNDAIGDKAKRAWIAYQNIRHAIAWSKVPPGSPRPNYSIRYNKPMNLLNEPMPEVTYDEDV